ncbi:MAG: GNAT family N-acetyltransferase [Chloracidobacterium sp.]|nr:GNAT family N-acetyltransferase [Chloracidobacterium sp.]MCO5333927.1 GNAT family N-acetyltransferase [Pyrinomonadaceae bacterium]
MDLLSEDLDIAKVTAAQFDTLLANGWRHFGTRFYRYNWQVYERRLVRVMALRIRLSSFRQKRSQRRVLTRNADLEVSITPPVIDAEVETLFHRHKLRFKEHIPESIFEFIAPNEAASPTTLRLITARDLEGRLVGASFFDLGEVSLSAIYSCFDPEQTRRSLGIFLVLKGIEYAIESDKLFYYHGYAFDVPSFYDYKKRFTGVERFNWNGSWEPLQAYPR